MHRATLSYMNGSINLIKILTDMCKNFKYFKVNKINVKK